MALAGALATRHECPGARPFPSAPTQRFFNEVLIGSLPAGERDLTGVVIRRQQVLLLARSVHPVHVPPSVDEALAPDCTQGFRTGVLSLLPKSQLLDSLGCNIDLPGSLPRSVLLFLGLLLHLYFGVLYRWQSLPHGDIHFFPKLHKARGDRRSPRRSPRSREPTRPPARVLARLGTPTRPPRRVAARSGTPTRPPRLV